MVTCHFSDLSVYVLSRRWNLNHWKKYQRICWCWSPTKNNCFLSIFFFLHRDRVKHVRIERKTKIKLVHMLAFIFSWSQSHEKNIPALFTSRKRQFNGQSDKYYKLNLGFVYCTLMPHLMRCFYPFIFISFTLSLSLSLSLFVSLSHTHTHTHTLSFHP